MSVCKYCSTIGGWHSFGCPAPHAATIYTRPEPPKPTEYRIEWTGGLKNYIPIKEQSCKPQS